MNECSLPLKLPNKEMNFSFSPLKLPNKREALSPLLFSCIARILIPYTYLHCSHMFCVIPICFSYIQAHIYSSTVYYSRNTIKPFCISDSGNIREFQKSQSNGIFGNSHFPLAVHSQALHQTEKRKKFPFFFQIENKILKERKKVADESQKNK